MVICTRVQSGRNTQNTWRNRRGNHRTGGIIMTYSRTSILVYNLELLCAGVDNLLVHFALLYLSTFSGWLRCYFDLLIKKIECGMLCTKCAEVFFIFKVKFKYPLIQRSQGMKRPIAIDQYTWYCSDKGITQVNMFNSQQTLHISPSGSSCVVSAVSIWRRLAQKSPHGCLIIVVLSLLIFRFQYLRISLSDIYLIDIDNLYWT